MRKSVKISRQGVTSGVSNCYLRSVTVSQKVKEICDSLVRTL